MGIGPEVAGKLVQKFLVTLNVKKIRLQLSSVDSISYSDDDVRKWLEDAGFEPRGQRWLVSEADLGHVDPSEVVEIIPWDPDEDSP